MFGTPKEGGFWKTQSPLQQGSRCGPIPFFYCVSNPFSSLAGSKITHPEPAWDWLAPVWILGHPLILRAVAAAVLRLLIPSFGHRHPLSFPTTAGQYIGQCIWKRSKVLLELSQRLCVGVLCLYKILNKRSQLIKFFDRIRKAKNGLEEGLGIAI